MISERDRLDLLAAGAGDPHWRDAATARTPMERRVLHLLRQLPEAQQTAAVTLALALGAAGKQAD